MPFACVYICVSVPTRINLSNCECPTQRMCDSLSTKGLFAELHSLPPTPTNAASKSQDKDADGE